MVHNATRIWPSVCAWLKNLARPTPGRTAALMAVIGVTLVVPTGVLSSFEQRLSDAWFNIENIAPSGRTVLVFVDTAAQLRGSGVRIARRDLAKLLLKLESAGAARVLIEIGLADENSELEDELLAQALIRLGPRVAISTSAIRAGTDEQGRWRRTAVFERFARHATLTASDLALDPDALLRKSGIDESGLLPLPPSPLWLSGTAHDEKPFRIDFGIDLSRIRTVDAESILQGDASSSDFRGSHIIIGNYSSATGYGIAAPRYVELRRPQVTALAAETLLLDRVVRTVLAFPATLGVFALAILVAVWCARLGVVAGAGVLAGFALCTLAAGAKLQFALGFIVPTASGVVACALGFAAAQVAVRPLFERVRQAAGAVLKGADLRLARAMDAVADGLVTFDAEGRYLSANAAARHLLGLKRAAGSGERLSDCVGPQAEHLLAAIHDRQPCRVQARVDQTMRWVELAVNAVLVDGRWIGVATVRDVTEQHARMESLHRLATEDALTGTLNRRAFEADLRQRLAGSDPFALLVCDLDGFKKVNDTLGHQAGDTVLAEIATRLREHTQPHGIIGRLGGDEFAIILPAANARCAGETTQGLTEVVARPIGIGSRCVTVGVSIGIALGPTTGGATALLDRADGAMYRAKVGRCGFDFARDQMAA